MRGVLPIHAQEKKARFEDDCDMDDDYTDTESMTEEGHYLRFDASPLNAKIKDIINDPKDENGLEEVKEELARILEVRKSHFDVVLDLAEPPLPNWCDATAQTQAEWAEFGVAWLSKTTDMPIPRKNRVGSHPLCKKTPTWSKEYTRACAAQRALAITIESDGRPTLRQKLSLRRMLLCLNLDVKPNLRDIMTQLDHMHNKTTQKAQDEAL